MTVFSATGTISAGAAVAAGGAASYPGASGQSVQESVGSQSQLASVLKAGLQVLSQGQVIEFTRYVKCVLPLDGFVFWVRASLLSPSALGNVSMYNTAMFGQPLVSTDATELLRAPGSLHIETTNQQNPDDSYAVNRVVFTSEVPVQDLNEISPMEMWLANYGEYRFAFSQRRSFYRQADLYHYVGDAVYPVMETQIIDDLSDFDTRSLIVSNSLPIWLRLSRFMPVFPAFLVPDNIRPPYASVYIQPENTVALQAAPYLDQDNNHWQLVSDRVRITIYGLRNTRALDFQDYVLAESLRTDEFGIMNMPIIRDEQRTQTELSVLAQKKSMEVVVSYYQAAMNNVARQLILEAIPTFYIGGGVVPVPVPGGSGQLDFSDPDQSGWLGPTT